MKSQAEIKGALERLILGELPAGEASRMAADFGYRTFADLCEAELPERLPKVRLDRSVVRRRLAQAVSGRLSLPELRAWAEELSAILDRHELGVSLHSRRRLSEALALTAVATDSRIFRNERPVLRVLAAIVRSLGRRRASSVAHLYGALFHGQPEFHLLSRRLDDLETEEDEAGPPTYLPQAPSFADQLGLSDLDLDTGLDGMWIQEAPEQPQQQDPEATTAANEGLRCADVVALNRPYEPGSRVQDYEWVVAFSVATRSLVAEDTVPSTAADGFLERVRDLAPNFDLSRFKPEARRDQDGVLEIVLDTASIGARELVYASKLFGLVHQVGRVYFEGRRVRTIAPTSNQRSPRHQA